MGPCAIVVFLICKSRLDSPSMLLRFIALSEQKPQCPFLLCFIVRQSNTSCVTLHDTTAVLKMVIVSWTKYKYVTLHFPEWVVLRRMELSGLGGVILMESSEHQMSCCTEQIKCGGFFFSYMPNFENKNSNLVFRIPNY